MYRIKAEDVHEDFSTDKKMFHVSNHFTGSKYYGNSKKSVVGRIKKETAALAIK